MEYNYEDNFLLLLHIFIYSMWLFYYYLPGPKIHILYTLAAQIKTISRSPAQLDILSMIFLTSSF